MLLREAEFKVGEKVAEFFTTLGAKRAEPVTILPVTDAKRERNFVGIENSASLRLTKFEMLGTIEKLDRQSYRRIELFL